MLDSAEKVELLPGRDEICRVIPGFLSPRLCRNFMSPRIKAGFRPARTHYPTYYRTNERQVVDDHRLAADFFQRLRPHAPETLPDPSGGGPWRIHSMNERLRFCRYLPGQFFGRHLDGIHHRTRDLQSRLTFMIYLNDAAEFRGGRTLFYESKASNVVRAEYHPRAGDLIIFDHKLWHEGEKVHAGEKYILRGDVLYERDPSSAADHAPFTPSHLGYVWKILRMRNGAFVTGGRDREIKIWNAKGELAQSARDHSHSILALEELEDGRFASGSRDGTIKIRQADARGTYHAIETITRHEGTVLSLRRLDAKRLASCGSDGRIFIQDFAGRELNCLTGHEDWVWDIAVLSNGLLVSVSQDGCLGLWNTSDSRPLSMLQNAGAPLNSLTVTPDGRVFTGDGEGHIHEWDFASERAIHTGSFAAHDGVIRALTPLGDWGLASGGEDNKVRAWTREGSLLKEFSHADFVQSLVHDESAGILYSASYDGTIRANALTPTAPAPEYP